ncbi:MAG: FAD-dependent oxidoreductase [Thermodesulfovibrionales bacterium]|nr:FAD-dependent oxidoreductase [Thermodesulfovibrionales bacterium]
MKHSSYLIIGGSAAGIACAQRIKETMPSCDVTVLTDEPHLPYFRPLITYIINRKKDVSDIAMIGRGPYTCGDLNIITDCKAKSLSIDQKTVSTNKGDFGYDKLLIATGSSPNIPEELKDIRCDGIFALRKLADAQRMSQMLINARHVVMLGGGLVNLKTAFAIIEMGIKVTMIVQSLEILSQLMEPDDTSLLKNAILNSGINVITGKKAIGVISNNNSVKAVVLDDSKEIPCDIVCIGKGVKPNVEFLDNSGIYIDKGVVVDRYTQTNIADVYSAGDIAVTFNPITGQRITTALWTNAVEMGRCAGLNMIGIKTLYAGTFGIMNATQIGGIPFVSMGCVHTKDTDYEVYTHKTDASYRKIVFNKYGTRLIGAILIADITNAGIYRYLIREGKDITKIKGLLINHCIHYGHLMQLNG